MAPDPRLLKVILLGDGGVGKSSIMNRFVHDKFDQHSYHTIGVEFLNKEIILDDEKFTLQIWDTAGQERFRSLRTPFYRGSDICILTFGLDDPATFKNLDSWRKEFFYYGDVKEEEGFPFLIIGNKCDVPATERKVSTQDAQDWCRQNFKLQSAADKEIPYLETSAKDATNVAEGFYRALRMWKAREVRSGIESNNFRDLGAQTVRLTRPRLFSIRSRSFSGESNGFSCCKR